MRICPECRRDYYDDTIVFCLDDGNRLLDGPAVSNTDATVLMTRPFVTPEASGQPDDITRLFQNDLSAYKPAAAGQTAERSIAVLPFVNVSADPENEYFCDGLAEDLINELARVDGLKVVARTTAFSFKGTTANASTIGNLLNVNTILEGSVRKAGDRLRINVQLINTADGFHLWTERYDRELIDIFEVQDEVTAAVMESLKAKFVNSKPRTGCKRYTDNVDAYQLYLQGRFFLNKFTADNFQKAIEFFEQALVIDPDYALAFAGMADAYIMLTELGPWHATDAMPKARENAQKALDLDGDLAEAHCSIGIIHRDFDYEFEAAEASFKAAIESEPGDPTAHISYGLLLSCLGRHAEADAQFRIALVVDPLSVLVNWFYSLGLFEARSYDECIAQSKKTLELDHNFPGPFLTLGFANQMKENYADAVEGYARFNAIVDGPHIAELMRESFSADGWTGFLTAMTGDKRPPELSSYIQAVFHTALDEKEKAIFELEEAFENRESYLAMLKVDPRLDALRDHPSFQKLIDTIGFHAQ